MTFFRFSEYASGLFIVSVINDDVLEQHLIFLIWADNLRIGLHFAFMVI